MSDATTTTSLPRLNEPAPQFQATATTGPIKLADYKGKWVVLFSHPADFTPVCSTEFAAFAERQADFDKRGVQLIGVSIDSVYSHHAWMRSVEQIYGKKITFPVIADLDMKVAHLYGMIHPGASNTATVRCVFFIDPNQVVRAMVYYPLNTGKGLATPANWKPGDKCVVPAPVTSEAIDKRMKEEGIDRKDWYLSLKN